MKKKTREPGYSEYYEDMAEDYPIKPIYDIMNSAINKLEKIEESCKKEKDYVCDVCKLELDNDELDWLHGDQPICPECQNKIDL